MKQIHKAAVAALVALVLALSAVAITATGPATASPAGAAAKAVQAVAEASGAAQPMDLYGMAMAAANAIAPSRPLAVREAAARQVAALSPAEIVAQAQLHAEDTTGAVGSFLTGCAIGGIAGAAAGGLGAGVGCVAGGIATLIWYQIGLAQGAAANQAQVAAWLRAMTVEMGNELNLTASAVGNELQALMLAQNSFSYAASNAALSQLGSATWNPYRAMNDSGVAAQLATFYIAESLTVGRIYQGVLNFGYSAFCQSGCAFSASYGTYWVFGAQVGGGNYPVLGQSTVPGVGTPFFTPGYASRVATSDSPYLYITQGSQVVTSPNNAAGATACTPSSQTVSPIWSLGTTYNVPTAQANWTHPSGIYFVNGGTTMCTLYGTGMMPVPSASYTTVHLPYLWPNSGSAPAYGTFQTLTTSSTAGITSTSGSSTVPTSGTVAYNLLPVSGWGLFSADLSNLVINAETAANAYWSFLRNLGYTSASQIPADCYVPMPYLALPPNLNLSTLSSDQLTSLYYAWLQGLGNFFNVTLTSANFCGQRPGNFTLGDNVTWDLNNVAVGSVYIPNVPGVVGQTFANKSSWAVSNKQLILMPTLYAIHIPVGQVYEVPALQSIGIYVLNVSLSTGKQIGFPKWYNLIGNGTQTVSTMSLGGVGTLQASPGAAIYLTSCIINGQPVTVCGVTVQTLNNTAANLTNQKGPGGGGGLFTLPNPFDWIGGLVCQLLGPAGLAAGCQSTVGAAVALLFTAVAAIVIVYAVLVLVRRKDRGRGRDEERVTVNLLGIGKSDKKE